MYTIDYFINKFKSIPDKMWMVDRFTDYENPYRHCALGHCGVTGLSHNYTEEAIALQGLFDILKTRVTWVNDAKFDHTGYGSSPKERILRVLFMIKEKMEGDSALKEVKEILEEPVLQLEEA